MPEHTSWAFVTLPADAFEVWLVGKDEWDSRDSAGRHAPSGRYLMRLAMDGRVTTTKLTLTR